MRALLVGTVAALLTGCAAHIETHPFDMTTWKPDATKRVNGIVYYQPQAYELIYEFTTRVDAKGQVADSGSTCTPQTQKTEIQILPDLAHPQVLLFKRGPLSSAKFSATLTNGMLTAVNTEVTSTTADLLKAVSEVAKTVAPGLQYAPGGTKELACNAGPVLAHIYRVDLPAAQTGRATQRE
jgi:hypothetical protein